jgi:hypothetical protein
MTTVDTNGVTLGIQSRSSPPHQTSNTFTTTFA